MNENPPIVFKRRAFAKDDGCGNSSADWTLTPANLIDPVQLVAEPTESIPIIFVPGIMGSNLKTEKDVDGLNKGDPVWLMNSEGGAFLDWYRGTPAKRQVRLNPATTTVFGGGDVPSDMFNLGSAESIRKNRFWGEISAMSYVDFLVWLQRTMNDAGRVDKWRAEVGRPNFAAHVAKENTFKPITELNVAHAAYFRYPVYACGYNWLRSNMDGAVTLAKRITEVIAANNSRSYTCQKVILVTHSMGGLVARACSELVGMRDKIAGVVHGVMPATGAAVAYKRVRAGTEGAAGLVLGDNAAKMTAVFANAPGALQLLPNKDYGSGWLRLGMVWQGSHRDIVQLPMADPYEEIYKQRGPWWALVREELIDPGKVDGHRGWTDYVKNVTKAAEFHSQLSGKYHPQTYTFHGDGKDLDKGLTWGTVGWRALNSNPKFDPCAEELLAQTSHHDNETGEVSIRRRDSTIPFYMTPKDSVGDGTVPVRSGEAPATSGTQATYHLDLSDVGHEGAYRTDMARRIALHSIVKIAQTVNLSL